MACISRYISRRVWRFFILPCLVGNVDRIRSQLAFHKRRCPCQSVCLNWRRSLINEATPLWRLLQLGRRSRELQLCYPWNGQVKGMTGELVFELSTEETQNTHEINRTLFNWSKHDKTCKFSRKSFSFFQSPKSNWHRISWIGCSFFSVFMLYVA